MNTDELLRVVEHLPETKPLILALKEELGIIYEEKEDILQIKWRFHGWIKEYAGPGFYKRSNPGQDAKFLYNHHLDPFNLLWLAEGLEVAQPILLAGCDAIRAGRSRHINSRGKIFRDVCPWEAVEVQAKRFLENLEGKQDEYWHGIARPRQESQ